MSNYCLLCCRAKTCQSEHWRGTAAEQETNVCVWGVCVCLSLVSFVLADNRKVNFNNPRRHDLKRVELSQPELKAACWRGCSARLSRCVFSSVYMAPVSSDQIDTKCLVSRPNPFTMKLLSPTPAAEVPKAQTRRLQQQQQKPPSPESGHGQRDDWV